MSSLDRTIFPASQTSHQLTSYKEAKSYVPIQIGAPLLYKKPTAICNPTNHFLPWMWKGPTYFAQSWMEEIQAYVSSCGLQLKLIEDTDHGPIKEFLFRRYCTAIAQEICAHDLFRFRNYGHGAILLDAVGKVQGTIFEVGYDTAEKTSYTLRLAVAEEWKGKNLAWNLMMYSSLKAMQQGSRVKRGIIQFDNLKSLYINLNKVGWICDKFEPSISGLGAFFHIALPLDPAGLSGNQINLDRCKAYIKHQTEGMDYRLLDSTDFEAIADMYASTSFKIVAVLPAGCASEQARFLALPANNLQMKP